MSKELAMSFVMKGLVHNNDVYLKAIETQDSEACFIEEVAELVSYDLSRYLEKDTEGTSIETKLYEVCENVGHVIIDYLEETGHVPCEEDWQLILSVLQARAEGRTSILHILGFGQKPTTKTDLNPDRINLAKKFMVGGDLGPKVPKLGDKVRLSPHGKDQHRNSTMTPYELEGVAIALVKTVGDPYTTKYAVKWDSNYDSPYLVADELVIVTE
jgi:hypothetical protein